MALSAPDKGATFARGDFANLAGIGDGVAAFWIKRGLLLSKDGGSGRGSHRRFDRMQVSIAALLGELQKFGINIGALTKFAELLQKSNALGTSISNDYEDIWIVTELVSSIHNFNNGSPRIIYPADCQEGRPAETLEELEQAAAWSLDYRKGYYLSIAENLPFSEIKFARLYIAIGEEMDKPHHGDGAIMLLWQVDDEWQFELGTHDSGFSRNDEVSSAIYLNISSVIHRTWSIDRTALEEAYEKRRAARLSSRESSHG